MPKGDDAIPIINTNYPPRNKGQMKTNILSIEMRSNSLSSTLAFFGAFKAKSPTNSLASHIFIVLGLTLVAFNPALAHVGSGSVHIHRQQGEDNLFFGPSNSIRKEGTLNFFPGFLESEPSALKWRPFNIRDLMSNSDADSNSDLEQQIALAEFAVSGIHLITILVVLKTPNLPGY